MVAEGVKTTAAVLELGPSTTSRCRSRSRSARCSTRVATPAEIVPALMLREAKSELAASVAGGRACDGRSVAPVGVTSVATRVDAVGRVRRRARWTLDWWIGADDRWHIPAHEAAVRQRAPRRRPVVETSMRVPAATRCSASTAIGGPGVVVVEIENASPAPFVSRSSCAVPRDVDARAAHGPASTASCADHAGPRHGGRRQPTPRLVRRRRRRRVERAVPARDWRAGSRSRSSTRSRHRTTCVRRS